ncbi:MAG: hypothetical protein CVV27_12850 [Candidatus Melainabacteria bacterium HGW-Melainabacteria-1]|nr:MAG: hypothetical protein CVV27_12850 [Candidatus Melainabacteria bacterium HGW-Melainabacteria-1]
MSDPTLKQLLADKGLSAAVQEPGVSHAMGLLLSQEYQLTESGELVLPDESKLTLKPLAELYAEAKPAAKDDEIMALCMAMEYAVAFFDHDHDHGLNDGDVIRVLEKLSLKPETSFEGVGGLLLAHLRLELSLGEYSRADVRQAVRKILRSAQRHSKGDPRGYLGFIHHLIH